MVEVLLYNSSVCRLCAEENAFGSILYSSDENGQKLCELINKYLPLKVSDDGILPCTICPGCTIQLEATVEFFNLIVNGQKLIRELAQKQYQNDNKEGVLRNVVYEINTDNGIYTVEHSISLQMAGLEKPKRKRGRPPKKPKSDVDVKPVVPAEADLEVEVAANEVKQYKEPLEPIGKRRRKTPQRFKEAVQGKELERIFREEGVIDGEESDSEQGADGKGAKENQSAVSRVGEVIGHLETPDGQPSGELVVVTKGKGRGRPKGRMRLYKQSCGICGMEFSCVGRYMAHVAQHGRVIYQCAMCDRTFTTRLNFNLHQEEDKHIGQKIIKCDEGMTLNKIKKNKRNGLGIKLKVQQTPETLPVDNIINNLHSSSLPTDNSQTASSILKTEAYQSLPEEIMDSSVASQDPLLSEEPLETTIESAVIEPLMDTTIQPDYPSEFLNEITDDSNAMNAGQIIVTSLNKELKPEPAGDSASVPEVNADSYVTDANIEENQDQIKEEKLSKVKPKLKCPHCPQTFNNRQNKSVHIKALHAGERPYVCKECGAAFPYPRSLSLHALTHRRANSLHGFACDLCGKVLNHPSSVVYHKESEHAGQRYVCLKCGKSFKHRQLLQRHQLVHSQLRPYSCKTCNATFKTKANLLNHQLLHSGVKKFSCELCKQSFAHKTSLTLHMRWHTGQKPYACTACGKSFTQKGNLAEHMRIHTGEKPYQCSECPRTFTTSSQHRLHARRHTGERPYECAQCGKRFMSRESWRGHVRREQGAREHRCDACGRAFCERWALLKHKRCHTGERPFSCPHCPRAFADCSNLNKHKKQIHKQQMSLLLDKQVESKPRAEPVTPAMSDVAESEMDDRVIYVTYSVGDDVPAFHILDSDQAAALDESKVLTTCDLYEGESLMVGDEQIELSEMEEPIKDTMEGLHDSMQSKLYFQDEELDTDELLGENQHMSVTDQDGNPIHFTMQDGTQLAITSSDGKSLQVTTQDGQTIPVELNGYCNEEEEQVEQEAPIAVEEDGNEPEGHTVRMLSFDDPAIAHYFTIV